MKQKAHSGAKKRIKVRKSGSLMVEKASRRHLLINKSKGQKSKGKTGLKIDPTKMQAVRRMLPDKV